MYRDYSIDVLKAYGIIMVLLGHISRVDSLENYIYGFHMPLFFFISGFIHHHRVNFVYHNLRKIVTPYLSFSFLSFFYWWLIESKLRGMPSTFDYYDQFINIIFPHTSYQFNVVLWFLPCLFICKILVEYIEYSIPKTITLLCYLFAAVIIMVLPWINYSFLILVKVSLYAFPFYVIGYYYGKNKKDVNNLNTQSEFKCVGMKNGVLRYVYILFILILPVLMIINGRNDLGTCVFAVNYYVFFLIALCYTISLYEVSNYCKNRKQNKRFTNCVLWLSNNSLILMVIHEPIKRIVIWLYSIGVQISIDIIRTSLIHNLVILILLICVLVPIVSLVNQHLSFLLGKKITI